MTSRTLSLDQISIATPCSASWEGMSGDDRRRFCDSCSKHVYNIAGMTEDEAITLITEAEGRLCVRLYRRRDGTILTKDCPVGLRALRRKMIHSMGKVAAVFMLVIGAVFFSRTLRADPGRTMRVWEIQPLPTIKRLINGQFTSPRNPPPPVMGMMLMGEVEMGGIAVPVTNGPPRCGTESRTTGG